MPFGGTGIFRVPSIIILNILSPNWLDYLSQPAIDIQVRDIVPRAHADVPVSHITAVLAIHPSTIWSHTLTLFFSSSYSVQRNPEIPVVSSGLLVQQSHVWVYIAHQIFKVACVGCGKRHSASINLAQSFTL